MPQNAPFLNTGLERAHSRARPVLDAPGDSTFPPKTELSFLLLGRNLWWPGSLVFDTRRDLFFARRTLGAGDVASV